MSWIEMNWGYALVFRHSSHFIMHSTYVCAIVSHNYCVIAMCNVHHILGGNCTCYVKRWSIAD